VSRLLDQVYNRSDRGSSKRASLRIESLKEEAKETSKFALFLSEGSRRRLKSPIINQGMGKRGPRFSNSSRNSGDRAWFAGA
jgi:hypothetical protein